MTSPAPSCAVRRRMIYSCTRKQLACKRFWASFFGFVARPHIHNLPDAAFVEQRVAQGRRLPVLRVGVGKAAPGGVGGGQAGAGGARVSRPQVRRARASRVRPILKYTRPRLTRSAAMRLGCRSAPPGAGPARKCAWRAVTYWPCPACTSPMLLMATPCQSPSPAQAAAGVKVGNGGGRPAAGGVHDAAQHAGFGHPPCRVQALAQGQGGVTVAAFPNHLAQREQVSGRNWRRRAAATESHRGLRGPAAAWPAAGAAPRSARASRVVVPLLMPLLLLRGRLPAALPA